eukprot:764000-Hanusia_phi.AAC.3
MSTLPELCVSILSAENLPKMDVLGSCDAYCILRWGEDQRKTSTIKGSYNPTWNEEFRFATSGGRDLEVKVMDWDRITKDDEVGSVTISSKQIDDLMAKPEAAEVLLDLKLMMGGKEVQGKQKQLPSTLKVRLSKLASDKSMIKNETEAQKSQYGMKAERTHITAEQSSGNIVQDQSKQPSVDVSLNDLPERSPFEHQSDVLNQNPSQNPQEMKSTKPVFVGKGYVLGRGSLKEGSKTNSKQVSDTATKKLQKTVERYMKNKGRYDDDVTSFEGPTRPDSTAAQLTNDHVYAAHDLSTVRESTAKLQCLLASLLLRQGEVHSEQEDHSEILSLCHQGYENNNRQRSPWDKTSIALTDITSERSIDDVDGSEHTSHFAHDEMFDATRKDSHTPGEEIQAKQKFLVIQSMKFKKPQAFLSEFETIHLTVVINETTKSKTNKVRVVKGVARWEHACKFQILPGRFSLKIKVKSHSNSLESHIVLGEGNYQGFNDGKEGMLFNGAFPVHSAAEQVGLLFCTMKIVGNGSQYLDADTRSRTNQWKSENRQKKANQMESNGTDTLQTWKNLLDKKDNHAEDKSKDVPESANKEANDGKVEYAKPKEPEGRDVISDASCMYSKGRKHGIHGQNNSLTSNLIFRSNGDTRPKTEFWLRAADEEAWDKIEQSFKPVALPDPLPLLHAHRTLLVPPGGTRGLGRGGETRASLGDYLLSFVSFELHGRYSG